jgi:hypothetical protein
MLRDFREREGGGGLLTEEYNGCAVCPNQKRWGCCWSVRVWCRSARVVRKGRRGDVGSLCSGCGNHEYCAFSSTNAFGSGEQSVSVGRFGDRGMVGRHG